jgi:hypothetical protein
VGVGLERNATTPDNSASAIRAVAKVKSDAPTAAASTQRSRRAGLQVLIKLI